MTNLIRAELLKIRTTRMWIGMLVLSLAFTAFNLIVLIVVAGSDVGGDDPFPPVTDPETVRAFYASASSGTLFMMILGIMGITTEYRFKTITQAFLTAPRRNRFLLAKLLSYFIFGALFGLAIVAFTIAVALPALAIKGGTTSLIDHDVPIILGGTILAMGLYALVGLGLGALIRNQIAAIVLAIVWVQLIEGILTFAVPKVGQWLPAGAVRALTRTTGFGNTNDLATLPAWGGTLLLLGYGLAFAAIATLTTTRRDIT